MYQWVYASSMVFVLMFGILKGLTFTKTTLMASSSLHDQVFDKVRLPGAAGTSHPLLTGFTGSLLCAGHCAEAWGRRARMEFAVS